MNRTIHACVISLLLVLAAGCSDRPDSETSNGDDATVTLKPDSNDSKDVEDDHEPSPDDDKGPLDVESGMVEYQLEGMTTGTITRYWRNYGAESAEYHDTSMNMMGFVQEDKKWIIMTPDTVYTIDRAAGTAMKAVNPASSMMGNMDRSQAQAFGKEMLKQMGQRDGEMEIAGKDCERWVMKQMGSEICIWKGVDLYSSSNMAGMGMKRTAVKLDTGSVDEKHFEVPDDIEVRDVGNPMDWQQKMEQARDMMPPNMQEMVPPGMAPSQ